jgi:hypothetical protein
VLLDFIDFRLNRAMHLVRITSAAALRMDLEFVKLRVVLMNFIDFRLNRAMHLIRTNPADALKLVVELAKIWIAQSEVPGRAIHMVRSRYDGA